MTIYSLVWYLFIYAFLGWCGEVVFAAVRHGRFVNRGFLCGPICPIYGFGVVAVLVCLEPLEYSWILTFLGASVLTTLMEFLTGFVLEKIFHQKWWDYSGAPLNIMGYVCLPFSLVWGAACLAVVYLVHPAIAGLVTKVPHTLGMVLLCVFGVAFAVDGTLTILSLLKLNRKIREIDELEARMRVVSDALGRALAEGAFAAVDAAERGREDMEKFRENAEDYIEKAGVRAKISLEDLRGRQQELQQAVQEAFSQKLPAAKRLSNAFPKLKKVDPAAVRERLEQLLQVIRAPQDESPEEEKSGTPKVENADNNPEVRQ